MTDMTDTSAEKGERRGMTTLGWKMDEENSTKQRKSHQNHAENVLHKKTFHFLLINAKRV